MMRIVELCERAMGGEGWIEKDLVWLRFFVLENDSFIVWLINFEDSFELIN